MAKGHGNALTAALGRAIGLVAKAFGRGNGPGMAKGRGNGPGVTKGRGDGAARGRGVSHASVGNPGHHALSTRSSHSQNTSHKDGSHDDGNFSSHSQLGHSLAADPTSNSTNADQASQIGDQPPDSVQSDPDQQANPGKTFSPKTIHSDPSDVLTLQVQLVSNLPAKNAEELSPDTIHSGHNRFLFPNLTFSPELQADRGEKSDSDAIASDRDATVTSRLAPLLGLNLDRSEFLPVSEHTDADSGTIAQYAEDTPATLLPDIEKYRVRKLQSIGDELDADDQINGAAWKLVPFYVVVVVLIFPLLLLVLKKL
jgi:hypothetical protein